MAELLITQREIKDHANQRRKDMPWAATVWHPSKLVKEVAAARGWKGQPHSITRLDDGSLSFSWEG